MTAKAKTETSNKSKVGISRKAKGGRSDLANFKIGPPSEKAWSELIQYLRLPEYEAHLLRLVVEDMIFDIKAYQASKEKEHDRARLRLGLSRIEKAFAQLEFELDRFKSTSEHFLPHAFSERLGDILNFSPMGEARGYDVFPDNFDGRLDRIRNENKSVTMETIEMEFSPTRKALGLKYSHEILPHIVKTLRAPLRNWFELDRLNRGGRPRHAIRQYMIERIARVAPELLGTEISTTKASPNFTLCNLVLVNCGVPEEGLDKAIAETFRKIVKT